jgi:bifunctional non-homologous end joining protein LigD
MTHGRLELRGDAFAVTDPDRRLHGATGPTKAEILAYYLQVAPRIMPFLRGRPVSTVWFPDDSTRESRFLRLAPAGFGGRFPSSRLPGRVEPYLTVPDRSTLAALVDHGCLSFHPWNSTAVASHRPDQIVFNLDREAIAFREVRNAALLLRNLLADYGLAAWVKTSGGQGLHVLVPVTGGASFDDVALVAETIVRRAIRHEPGLFSRDQRAGRRRGRILLDISRNDPAATIIAPYAVATSGLVSALLEWEELTRPMYPEDFTMDRVLAREDADLKNEASFFRANQSLAPLARGKRSRRVGIPVHPCVHGYTEWLVARA